MNLDFYLKTEPATGKFAKQINEIYRRAYQLAKKSGPSRGGLAQVGEKYEG